MALTLDDVMTAPTDTDELIKHLQDRGHLPVQPMMDTGAPLVPSTVVKAPLSPVNTRLAEPMPLSPVEKHDFETSPGTVTPATGRNADLMLNSTNRPLSPVAAPGADMTAPDLGGGSPAAAPPSLAAPGAGPVKPMIPPTDTSQRPGITAPVNSSEFWKQKISQEEWDKANPWGSANNHPGVGGKIAHVLANIGNTAGEIVAPGITAAIPGSRLSRNMRENAQGEQEAAAETRENAQRNTASEIGLRDIQGKNIASEQSERENKNPQELVKDADNNVTGWKDRTGALHSMADAPDNIRQIAEDAQKAPKYETDKNSGNIVKLTTDKDGKTTSEVVYKGQPNVKTETRSIVGQDGKAHDKVFDITPGSNTFGKELADLGRAKEDKTPSAASEIAKQKADERWVMGMDKNGEQHLVSKATADEMGLSHITQAGTKQHDDAAQNTKALNDMSTRLKHLYEDRSALDQGPAEKALMAVVLHNGPDSVIGGIALSHLTEKSKAYVDDLLSMRESALGLPKQLTGGSRVSEIQAEALWKTISQLGDSGKDAERRIRTFDQNLDRLYRGVANIEENPKERAFPGTASKSKFANSARAKEESEASGGGGGNWTAPKGAPSAKGVPDGKVLKDAQGNVVARAKGGAWGNPNSQ